MRESFKTLKRSAKNVREKTQLILSAMPLPGLRQARQISQQTLAEILATKQANVSKLERRSDMYVSTLRSYIEAMGGQLDIIAKFPDSEIHINQFESST